MAQNAIIPSTENTWLEKKIPLKLGGKSTQTNNNRSPQNAKEISEETNETNGRFSFRGAPKKDKKVEPSLIPGMPG